MAHRSSIVPHLALIGVPCRLRRRRKRPDTTSAPRRAASRFQTLVASSRTELTPPRHRDAPVVPRQHQPLGHLLIDPDCRIAALRLAVRTCNWIASVDFYANEGAPAPDPLLPELPGWRLARNRRRTVRVLGPTTSRSHPSLTTVWPRSRRPTPRFSTRERLFTAGLLPTRHGGASPNTVCERVVAASRLDRRGGASDTSALRGAWTSANPAHRGSHRDRRRRLRAS